MQAQLQRENSPWTCAFHSSICGYMRVYAGICGYMRVYAGRGAPACTARITEPRRRRPPHCHDLLTNCITPRGFPPVAHCVKFAPARLRGPLHGALPTDPQLPTNARIRLTNHRQEKGFWIWRRLSKYEKGLLSQEESNLGLTHSHHLQHLNG